MSQPALIEEFSQRAVDLSATVQPAADLATVIDYAVKLTLETGGRTLAAPGWEGEELAAIEAACVEAGVELFSQDLRAQADNIYCGLTKADWGVAETGTLVIDSRSEDLRLATMLAEVHVAVLPAANLRPNLEALHDEIDALFKQGPAYVAFISGPSRTGDIEMVLALGAHGPRQVHIMLLEDAS